MATSTSTITVPLGETNLTTLFTTMSPTLHPDTFVFCTLSPNDATTSTNIPHQMLFHEASSTTLITTAATALAHNIPNTFPSRMITLSIHSSLSAIGFLAAITTKLAKARIAVNPVSGFYHDHLFVPVEREAEAMQILEDMGSEARREAEVESVEERRLKEMIDGLIAGQKGDWSGRA